MLCVEILTRIYSFRAHRIYTPRVSIIIPTANRLNMLRRALRSVFSQSYQNFEIIVVDDGPANNCKMLFNEFCDERLRYYHRGRTEGVASARNFGIKVSSGEFIAFLDDDDEWLPTKLEKQVRLLQKKDDRFGIVHTNCYIDNGQELLVCHNRHRLDQSFRKLLEQNFVANSTCLIRRKCFDMIGDFDEKIPYAEDWEFFIRASRLFKFVYINQPLAILHWKHEGSKRLSVDLPKTVKGHIYLVFKHWKEYEKHRKILARQLYIIGLKMESIGEQKFAQWCISKSSTLVSVYFLLALLFYAKVITGKKIKTKMPVRLRTLCKAFVEFLTSL